MGAAACCFLLAAGLASGAASFADTAGDHNPAPDITSVQLSESAEGMITVTVAVANFQQLPPDSWFNLWFDVDSNANTGNSGDETLVHFPSAGDPRVFDWNGTEMVERPAPGVAGGFAAGVLTVTVPKADLGGDSLFGVLAVSSRAQTFGESELIASDFAPDRGSSAYAGPAVASFPDPRDDEDAAPDVTAVRVTDSKDGWITFAISTPNYATLPGGSLLALAIDRDGRRTTGDAGAELLVTGVAGRFSLERWNEGADEWVDDPPPSRVRMRNSENVVTIDVHRSELDNARRFGFSVTTIDADDQSDSPLAADFAPDNGGFYTYALVNRPALELVAQRVSATPAQPRAGRPFTVRLAVRRSDTNRGITSGAVTCRATLGAEPLRGTGSVAGGAARCAFVLPRSSARSVLRGTITVRVAGKSAKADFSYVVR